MRGLGRRPRTPDECDEWGMTEALRVAARACPRGPGPGTRRPHRRRSASTCCATPRIPSPASVRPIVDGDAKCASVAAASVLAKVVRDRLMREEADHFPVYGFERNKGYPSPVHQTALRGYGPSAIHRCSWAFVAGPALARAGPAGSDDLGDLGEVAGHGVSLAPVDQGRLFGGADLLGLPAAGAEAAA